MSESTRTAGPQLSPEEAAEVIREATRLQVSGPQTLSRDDVLAMGRELGLSEDAVERALTTRAQRAAQRTRVRRGLVDLGRHATSYIVAIGGMALLDFITGPGWWVQWPAMGWGIGLASHALSAMRRMKSERVD